MSLAVGLGIILILASCQSVVPIQRKSLGQPMAKAKGRLVVGDLAEHVRKEAPTLIGYHTFTIFALKMVAIQPAYPGIQKAMTKHIIKALETAGYEVVPAASEENGTTPVLRGEIRKFWFASYWWLWPIAVVGGSINYQLILEDPSGKLLWESKCDGSAFIVLPSFALVDFLVKDSVTDICNDVIKAVTSEEFKTALGS